MDRNEEKPAKQKSRLKITHAQNDARYVEMGKLLHLQKDPGSDGELDRMNANKNGRPYQYPDVAVMAIAGIRSIYGTLSYRMCQGMASNRIKDSENPSLGFGSMAVRGTLMGITVSTPHHISGAV